MVLAKAADAVLRRLVPQVEAGAACSTACQYRYEFCKDNRVYFSYWTRFTSCAWNKWCYSRRTGNACV
jgi:hypothetical protein